MVRRAEARELGIGSRLGEMAQRHKGTKAQRGEEEKPQRTQRTQRGKGCRLKDLRLIVILIVIVIERKGETPGIATKKHKRHKKGKEFLRF